VSAGITQNREKSRIARRARKRMSLESPVLRTKSTHSSVTSARINWDFAADYQGISADVSGKLYWKKSISCVLLTGDRSLTRRCTHRPRRCVRTAPLTRATCSTLNCGGALSLMTLIDVESSRAASLVRKVRLWRKADMDDRTEWMMPGYS